MYALQYILPQKYDMRTIIPRVPIPHVLAPIEHQMRTIAMVSCQWRLQRGLC